MSIEWNCKRCRARFFANEDLRGCPYCKANLCRCPHSPMTPPQKTEPSPTLLEDLEAVAADEDEAANHPYCDPEPHRKYALRAARLRSAAARLKEEMELAAPSSEQWNSHVTAVLKRINGGPQDVKP